MTLSRAGDDTIALLTGYFAAMEAKDLDAMATYWSPTGSPYARATPRR